MTTGPGTGAGERYIPVTARDSAGNLLRPGGKVPDVESRMIRPTPDGTVKGLGSDLLRLGFKRGVRLTHEQEHDELDTRAERQRKRKMTEFDKASEVAVNHLSAIFPEGGNLQDQAAEFFRKAGVKPPEIATGTPFNREAYLQQCGQLLVEVSRDRLYGRLTVGQKRAPISFNEQMHGTRKLMETWSGGIVALAEQHERQVGIGAVHMPHTGEIKTTGVKGLIGELTGAVNAGAAANREGGAPEVVLSESVRAAVGEGLKSLDDFNRKNPLRLPSMLQKAVAFSLGRLIGGARKVEGMTTGVDSMLTTVLQASRGVEAADVLQGKAYDLYRSIYRLQGQMDVARRATSLFGQGWRWGRGITSPFDPNSYVDGLLGSVTGREHFLDDLSSMAEPFWRARVLQDPNLQMELLMDQADQMKLTRRAGRSLGIGYLPGLAAGGAAWAIRTAARKAFLEVHLKPLEGTPQKLAVGDVVADKMGAWNRAQKQQLPTIARTT